MLYNGGVGASLGEQPRRAELYDCNSGRQEYARCSAKSEMAGLSLRTWESAERLLTSCARGR